jgi:hypothetical protein
MRLTWAVEGLDVRPADRLLEVGCAAAGDRLAPAGQGGEEFIHRHPAARLQSRPQLVGAVAQSNVVAL